MNNLVPMKNCPGRGGGVKYIYCVLSSMSTVLFPDIQAYAENKKKSQRSGMSDACFSFINHHTKN